MALWLLLLVVGSNQQVLGFLGESVTLSPGLDLTQQKIDSIKWLIMSNDTWIATYRHQKTTTNHFWTYMGRLHLDISSGVCVWVGRVYSIAQMVAHGLTLLMFWIVKSITMLF